MPLGPEIPQMTDRLLVPYHMLVPFSTLPTKYSMDSRNPWQRLNRSRHQIPVDNPRLRRRTGPRLAGRERERSDVTARRRPRQEGRSTSAVGSPQTIAFEYPIAEKR
jgi:hypothetical protein